MLGGLSVGPLSWGLFAAIVVVSLIVDLVVHRGDRELGRRSAMVWTGVWIALALVFAGWIWLRFGPPVAAQFLAAYLIEKSLSVDNLFVFLVIFGQLKVPRAEQHRVLFWGIVGAFAFRALFIGLGAAILSRWHFATYVLGAFLVFTGIKTLRTDPHEKKESPALEFLVRHVPFTKQIHGHAFFVREQGRRVATPLFMALLAIEVSDILFAVDSIPAVFAISSEPFIVFSSNVFAILGLRALYLVIADLVADLEYLHLGLGVLLCFVGVKMMASEYVKLPYWLALLITAVILTAAVVPSLVVRRRRRKLSAMP